MLASPVPGGCSLLHRVSRLASSNAPSWKYLFLSLHSLSFCAYVAARLPAIHALQTSDPKFDERFKLGYGLTGKEAMPWWVAGGREGGFGGLPWGSCRPLSSAGCECVEVA